MAVPYLLQRAVGVTSKSVRVRSRDLQDCGAYAVTCSATATCALKLTVKLHR